MLDQFRQHVGRPFFVRALCPDYNTSADRRGQEQDSQYGFTVGLLKSVLAQQLDLTGELRRPMNEASGGAGVQAQAVGYRDFSFLQGLN